MLENTTKRICRLWQCDYVTLIMLQGSPFLAGCLESIETDYFISKPCYLGTLVHGSLLGETIYRGPHRYDLVVSGVLNSKHRLYMETTGKWSFGSQDMIFIYQKQC